MLLACNSPSVSTKMFVLLEVRGLMTRTVAEEMTVEDEFRYAQMWPLRSGE